MTQKVLFGVLFFLLLGLSACSPSTGLDQAAEVRATWTPIVQPTDQPNKIKTETLSYFGETPALLIFGSQDPADDTPLKVLNISTDDDYDVSTITPAPVNTWSRPIAAENKTVYFQIGGMLYVLSPGGQTHSIELPYDEENPAYCNWSWKGQLVCLNDSITTGFLVDQDLNVVELELSADGGDASDVYYEPYRVGENGIRTIQVTPEVTNRRATVFYKDLDLETLTVQTQQIRIEEDFNQEFTSMKNRNELDVMVLNRIEGEIDVIGISDSGDRVYFASHVTYNYPYRGGSTKTRWWVDVYDGSTLETLNPDFEIFHDVDKIFKAGYLITGWLFDPGSGVVEQPTVYDLEVGEIVFSALGSLDNNEIINFILPFGDGWVAGDSLAVYYYRSNGGLMVTFDLPEEIIASMGPDSYYTITQPIEP